jgi:N-acyl-D-amino-acid deacylase
MYADVNELAALAKRAGAAGGFYATHLRDEGDTLVEAVQEALAVVEASGAPLQLSHHKSEKPRNWGKVVRTLALVDEARACGLDVLLDQYPYAAYQTSLATIVLPAWAMAGTPKAMAEKLADPEMRARVRAAMAENGVHYDAVQIAAYAPDASLVGRTVADLAQEAGPLDPRDWLLDLFARGEAFPSAVHHALSEDDVERVMCDGRVMIGSDAVAASPTGPASGDRPHPRSYGTFARVLGRYVRERGLLSIEEAIRRMTSLPAARLGWPGPGPPRAGRLGRHRRVRTPTAIRDTATFAEPHALAVGVEYVLVNGTLTWANGVATGARAGRVLRRSGPNARGANDG